MGVRWDKERRLTKRLEIEPTKLIADKKKIVQGVKGSYIWASLQAGSLVLVGYRGQR